MQNIGFQSLGVCRKQNVKVLGLKVGLEFYLSLFFFPFPFTILARNFLWFVCLPLVVFILVRIDFGKPLRIARWDGRKCRLVGEEHFHRNFLANLKWFCLFLL